MSPNKITIFLARLHHILISTLWDRIFVSLKESPLSAETQGLKVSVKYSHYGRCDTFMTQFPNKCWSNNAQVRETDRSLA